MELQKESLQHPASQSACPKKPGLMENRWYCENMWLKEVTEDRSWQPPAQGSELGNNLPGVCLLLPKEMCVPTQLAEWPASQGSSTSHVVPMSSEQALKNGEIGTTHWFVHQKPRLGGWR